MSIAYVDFCGEVHPLEAGGSVTIGREGDVVIDDNPYLHRRFLEVSEKGSLVWLANVGSTLTATVSDQAGTLQAWLAPGARLPLVFGRTVVWFTAGPTTYEAEVVVEAPLFAGVASTPEIGGPTGQTTIGRIDFTPDQHLLVIALAENVLRKGGRGAGTIPTSALAAQRLGWTITKFNRKLDNVCDKLTRAGVRGLHGDAARLAVSRRARLVEYALAARLVTADDLGALPR